MESNIKRIVQQVYVYIYICIYRYSIKLKFGSFKKINKIDKSLKRPREKSQKTQITDTMNERKCLALITQKVKKRRL